LADNAQPVQEETRLADRIVSVSQGEESPSRSLGARPRQDRDGLYLRLQFATIYVSDQERSLEFYRGILGFRLVVDVRFASGVRWVEVAPPDGTATLALVSPRPGCDEERLVGTSASVAFITEDVEAKYQEWSARGVKFTWPPQTPGWGGVFCRFEDPDGNAFMLAGFDEMTRQVEENRRIAAERHAAEERAAQELEIAKQVQARLFPQRFPAVSTLDYAGVCHQARSVGGDYYDFLDLGAGRLALVIGDIAGKGMAAALLMANLQASLRNQCVHAGDQPEVFLSAVSRQLLENSTESAYATLFFADYDQANGRLRYANCGHLPAVILRCDGGLRRLDATCAVVGLFAEWECTVAESHLEPGDVLALYTDGVTETFNEAGEEFGEERLVDTLRRSCGLTAREIGRAVVDEVLAFGGRDQFDDITLVIAKRLSA